MIPYILHVTVITTICFLFYKLLLQKETFYRLNRWMLMGSLAVAFVLPLLPAPRLWSWRGSDVHQTIALPVAVREQPVVERTQPAAATTRLVTTERPVPDQPVSTRAGATVQRTNQPAAPEKQGSIAKSSITISQVISVAAHWLFYVYLFGALVFGINFLLRLAVLLYQSYANPVIWDGRFRIIEAGGNRAPCSFGNTIFINPANYDWETYNQILIHEKTHVSGRHTVDILLAEVAVVLQWFNPIAWLYRREVENNLEFLTDESVLLHQEVERFSYQLSLLRVSAPHLSFSITNNYNQSLLKRRIVMMNSKRSSRHTVWKYFFLLPIFTALVCVLNKPAAYGQQTKTSGKTDKKGSTPAGRPADKANPWALPAVPSDAAAPAGAAVAAPGVNVAPVVAVNAQPAAMVSPAPSVTVRTVVNIDADELTDGSWFVTTTDGKLWFELKAEEEDHSWSHTLSLEKSEINPFPGMGNVTFKLVRDAGTMTFTGQFDGQQGFGHFHFQADEGYFKALQQMGIEEIEGRRQLSFFLSNVRKDYAEMILHNGYPHISARMLVSLAAMHIDREFIQYWREMGLAKTNDPDPKTLITLKARNIDKGYVEELKAAGYDHLTAREMVSLKSQQGFQAVGYKDIPARELISLKSQGITPEFVKGFRDVGYDDISPSRLSGLGICGRVQKDRV